MASMKVMLAAVVVVVIIVAAGVLVIYPKIAGSSKPATTPGTSFISPGVIGNNIGGSWQKSYYVSSGSRNLGLLTQSFESVLSTNGGAGISLAPSLNISTPGNVAISLIGYSEGNSGGNLIAAFVYYPNSTMAATAYANLTVALQANSSVILDTGTVSGTPYTYANITGGQNATQLIYSQSGNYLVAFAYTGAKAVSESGMVGMLKSQLEVLGTSYHVTYPSELVSPSQVNSTLSMKTDSYAYLLSNISDLSSIVNLASGALGNASTGTSGLEAQYLGNLTSVGVAAFGDSTDNVTAVSSFFTFTSSTYSSSLFEDANAIFSSNSAYSSSYHQGTVNGNLYFFVNVSISPNSTAQVSLIFCASGNSLIVQAVLAGSVYSYSQMIPLTTAQISDL